MLKVSKKLSICAGFALSASFAMAGDVPTTKMAPLASESAAQRRELVRNNQGMTEHSVARKWNEVLLDSVRKDFARPTVHARNLYHTSAGM